MLENIFNVYIIKIFGYIVFRVYRVYVAVHESENKSASFSTKFLYISMSTISMDVLAHTQCTRGDMSGS